MPRRLAQKLVLSLTLIVLVLATFFMVRLIPGDPAELAVGFGGTQFECAEIQHECIEEVNGSALARAVRG